VPHQIECVILALAGAQAAHALRAPDPPFSVSVYTGR